MNVALPAIVAFLILLPGFIFRSRLKRAERTSLDYSPFGQVVTEGILWAITIHIVWLAALALLFSRYLDATLLLKLMGSEPSGQAAAISAVGANFLQIGSYFATILFASYALPAIIRWLITRFRLDRHGAALSATFRFHQAPWYYLLTGADFSEEEQPDFIVISAIVNVAGDAMLFTGVLDEFFVDFEGKLDRVVLQEVMRRPLASDKTPDADDSAPSRFYPIDGDYFVLRYSETITFNVEYIKLIEAAVPCAQENQPITSV